MGHCGEVLAESGYLRPKPLQSRENCLQSGTCAKRDQKYDDGLKRTSRTKADLAGRPLLFFSLIHLSFPLYEYVHRAHTRYTHGGSYAIHVRQGSWCHTARATHAALPRGRGCLNPHISDGRGLVGRVLEAELEHGAAPAVLRDIVGNPLAPLVDGKAGKGGVVLVPVGDQLLEVARAV